MSMLQITRLAAAAALRASCTQPVKPTWQSVNAGLPLPRRMREWLATDATRPRAWRRSPSRLQGRAMSLATWASYSRNLAKQASRSLAWPSSKVPRYSGWLPLLDCLTVLSSIPKSFRRGRDGAGRWPPHA